MNRSYHPSSWSQQAREMCGKQVMWVENGTKTVQQAIEFFGKSYRHPLITGRAAKRFGRLLRAGKIHIPA